MNKLILYAIIIAIIYHICFKPVLGAGKEGYSERSWMSRDDKIEEFKKLAEEYKAYSNETNLDKKKQIEASLLQNYEAFKQKYPDVFQNGIIPEEIMRMI